MLGEKLGEDIGQVTGMRVLPSPNGIPQVETSFQASGVFLGTQATDIGTFVSTPRPDGNYAGEGQGILRTEDGDVATWTGTGIGVPGPGGAVSWRGCVYYQSASEKLARLNGCAGVYEFDVDASGKVEARIWEWK